MNNPTKFFGNEMDYIKKVLASENMSSTSGTWVNEFESKFSKYIGSDYCIAANSGTATLHMALYALGIGYGDEVIVPALGPIMTSAVVFQCNATPVCADVDIDTFIVDPEDIIKKITNRTKAIIVVSLYGLRPYMSIYKDIADKHGLYLIEDNAQSLYEGMKVYGDFASFSFENTKILTCGEGGALLTNDCDLARKARMFGNHGFKNSEATEGRTRLRDDVFQDPNYLRHSIIGFNYRMPEVSGAIMVGQLENANILIEKRVNVANMFLDVIGDCDWLIPQVTHNNLINTYYTLAVSYLGRDRINVEWQEFRELFISNGGTGLYGCWALPFNEPAISNHTYIDKNSNGLFVLPSNQCCVPTANYIQPLIMQFKTNARHYDVALNEVEALKKTISAFM